MKPRGSTRSSRALDSCTFHLQYWSPFKQRQPRDPPHKPSSSSSSSSSKRHCRYAADFLDLSALSLADEPPPPFPTGGSRTLLPHRKRRRDATSRSVSGRSSDRSVTRRRCCSVGGSCSDLAKVAAGGTDSSGEPFANGGEVSWGSDVSEVRLPPVATARKEVGMMIRERERDGLPVLLGGGGGFALLDHLHTSEPCGYGSETGYKGDAEEIGYDDELDEEDDDTKPPLFWRERFDEDAFPEMKSHPRCRRKRQDSKIIASVKE